MKTFNMKDFSPVAKLLPPSKRGEPMIFEFTETCILLFEEGSSRFFTGEHRFEKGFTTDGATVPRALWATFPPLGMYFPAACMHDWYCYEALKRRNYAMRKLADKTFYSWCRQCGVSKARAWSMGQAVVRYGQWQNLRGVYE